MPLEDVGSRYSGVDDSCVGDVREGVGIGVRAICDLSSGSVVEEVRQSGRSVEDWLEKIRQCLSSLEKGIDLRAVVVSSVRHLVVRDEIVGAEETANPSDRRIEDIGKGIRSSARSQ